MLDPKCPMNCMLGCGDGRIDRGEECEGSNLNGAMCSTIGFVGGDLQCDAECQFVETGCHNCGDGITQAGEQCDMTVDGYDCVAAGHLDGTVTCTATDAARFWSHRARRETGRMATVAWLDEGSA